MHRCSSRLLKLTAAMAVLVLAAACSQEKPGMERARALQAEAGEDPHILMPDPGALLTKLELRPAGSRQSSYVPADLLRPAEDYEAALPRRNVAATPGGLAFQPENDMADGLAGRAYAFYSFQVTGYEGEPSLTPVFNSAPAQEGELFIALANWDAQRWDWFALGADGAAHVAGLAPYTLFNGTILACVLQSGSGGCELDSLRIGTLPPQPALRVTPQYGRPPLSVTFDASDSLDPDGSIKQYKWDPEGDGTFGISTGSEPLLEYVYEESGSFEPGLRIYDDSGVYADLRVEVQAVDSALHTFGGPDQDEQCFSAVVLPDGDLILLGAKGILQDESWAHFQRLSPDGSSGISRTWLQDFGSRLSDSRLYGDHVYACGHSRTNETGQIDYDGLVQKWDLQGNLIWSRRIGPPGWSCFLWGVTVAGSEVYVAGQIYAPASPSRAFVASIDTDGKLQWAREFSTGYSSGFNDIVYTSAIDIQSPILRLCGNYSATAGKQKAFYAGLDGFHELTSAYSFGTEDDFNGAEKLVVNGVLTQTENFVSGIVSNSVDGTRRYVSKVGGATVTFLNPQDITLDVVDLLHRGSSICLLMSSSPPGPYSSDMVLVNLDTSLNILSASGIFGVDTGEAFPGGLLPYGADGMLVYGALSGALPELTSYSPTAGTSALSWEAFSPGIVDSAQVEVIQTSTVTVEESGFAFDREEADLDCAWGILP